MNLSPTEPQLILFLNTPRDEEWRLFESEAAEKNPEYYRGTRGMGRKQSSRTCQQTGPCHN